MFQQKLRNKVLSFKFFFVFIKIARQSKVSKKTRLKGAQIIVETKN